MTPAAGTRDQPPGDSDQPAPGRLVVGVDGSPCAEQALVWALRQAVLTGASVDVLTCWQRPMSMAGAAGFGPYVEVDLTDEMTEILAKAIADGVADVAGAGTLTVRSRVVEAYPANALLDAAVGADLLVVGSRGHGELSGLLLGSTGLHCATHAPCPVVVVRGPAGRP